LDQLHGVLCFLVAAAAGVGLNWRVRQADKVLKWVAFGCASAGCLTWLTVSYSRNLPLQFVASLGMLALLLALLQLALRIPFGLAVAANTLILLCLALPVADFLTRPARTPVTDPSQRLYSYSVSGRDPGAFARWWDAYRDQWESMGRQVFMSDPEGWSPLRLRPNSEGWLFRSRIRINRLGFRGPEIREPKGHTYRIVALGESTTFGCTLNEGDRPWPELLEEMLRTRLKLRCPVEVINAGVPACNLEHNLRRLAADILPLKPDMILSYHGFNGFRLLDEALPSVSGTAPPAYPQRPLKLLADCEYRLKMLRFRKRHQTKPVATPAVQRGFMNSRYAQAYRQLIDIARTNGITLALANFSMAVNQVSDPKVIEFYRGGFPSVYAQIGANELHSSLVSQLGRENQILLIDTQPALDGQNEKFIDLVHLTQEGRQSLAEAVYRAIETPLRNLVGAAGISE
jgi:lysophospholipase L1-like esterase